MWLLLLFACNPDVPPDCVEGFEMGEDGLCYQAAPQDHEITLADLLDSLEDCEPLAAGDEIDLASGCIEGLCTGMTLAELEAAAGEVVECDTDEFVGSGYTFRWADCTFSNGVEASFSSYEDGVEATDNPVDSLTIEEGYVGSSPEGIGIDADMVCLYAYYGVPYAVELQDVLVGPHRPTYMQFLDAAAYDYPYDEGGIDGRVDRLRLYTAR